MRRVQRDDLSSAYDDKDSNAVGPALCTPSDVIMTLLLVFAIRVIWEELKHPPATGDGMTDRKTTALAAYFGITYVGGWQWRKYYKNKPLML